MCYTCGCKLPYDDHGDPNNVVESDFEKAGDTETINKAGVRAAKQNMFELIQLQKEAGDQKTRKGLRRGVKFAKPCSRRTGPPAVRAGEEREVLGNAWVAWRRGYKSGTICSPSSGVGQGAPRFPRGKERARHEGCFLFGLQSSGQPRTERPA